MKTFNSYRLAYFLCRTTGPVENQGPVNDTDCVPRYFLAVALTLFASLGVSSIAKAEAGQPLVPVNISLNSVTAISSNDMWAIGNGTDSEDPDNTDPAFEHWDGSQWTLVPGERTLEDDETMSGRPRLAPTTCGQWEASGNPSRFLAR